MPKSSTPRRAPLRGDLGEGLPRSARRAGAPRSPAPRSAATRAAGRLPRAPRAPARRARSLRSWRAVMLTTTESGRMPASIQRRPWHAGLAQRPGADRHEQAGIVGERQERFGREHAVARMAPAQQRLRAHHLARGDVDARLVDEEELAALDAVAQLVGERGRRGRVLVQQRRRRTGSRCGRAPWRGTWRCRRGAAASPTSSPSCGTQAMPMLAPELTSCSPTR